MQQRLFTFESKVPAANVAYYSQDTNQAKFFKPAPPLLPNNTQASSLSAVDYSRLDVNANLLLATLLFTRQKSKMFVEAPLTALDELDHSVKRALLKYQKLN
ncbi:hypothetical protein [Rickettsiella endosymbiont of Dermanyssus gallinae]|uniref:hypothetical protein n=1 Tax=Rickettsiella endosymbiont of Dermanyssus gallinae TaxID=2856608 RepID=UPI001C528597|nr:hypothetical protein [Rickettsiella endosymbiont of Dermanyssus gallinae]